MAGASEVRGGGNLVAKWSEFEKQLGIIHGDSSSSSSSGTRRESYKIYLLTGCASSADWFKPSTNSTTYYCVYCVDVVNNDPPQSLKPILVWDLKQINYDCYAIVGSTLYMFYGCSIDPPGRNPRMSMYDMSNCESSSSPSPLSKDSLETGPPPKGRKPSPLAVVIGDSTICLFPAILYLCSYRLGIVYSYPCFEFFNTNTKKWKALPEPPIRNSKPPIKYSNHSFLEILSYSVHSSCLIIHTSHQRIYGIDLNNPRPRWVTLDQTNGLPSFVGRWAMFGNMLCTTSRVLRKGDLVSHPFTIKSTNSIRQSLSVGLSPSFSPGPSDALSTFDDNNVCIVQLASDKMTPHLLIDIVNFDDDNNINQDVSKWKEIQSEMSSTFAFAYPSWMPVYILACFPIKKAVDEVNG